MEERSILTNWIKFNKKNSHIWSNIILLLVSISFAVTDWVIGIFTLSDYIFGLVGICLLVSGNYKVKRKQIKWVVLTLGVITINILMNSMSNELFVLKTGVAALIKVAYYTALVIGVYNYTKDKKLEGVFLKFLNIVAVVICIIGAYITIALYTKGELPYEFFWKFTRGDLASYTYGWDSNLIRTKSIFSEPSYLGYYLNIILGMNYFNKLGIKINSKVNIILISTILLTFSYSSIAIVLLIQLMHLIKKKELRMRKWDSSYLIIIIVFLMLIFFFRDMINETIIKRTLEILNGEDTSSFNRLLTSWQYINIEHFFMGNGINHTPDIWNIYAYILSDLGLIAFAIILWFTFYILRENVQIGVLFITLNFQKGGYLSNSFWILLLLIVIYSNKHSINKQSKKDYGN